MERRSRPIGFLIKQINNVFEKELNERLKHTGITSSQCAVLDYLFHTSKEEVNQRDVEKNLNLKNPTVTGILKRLIRGRRIFILQKRRMISSGGWRRTGGNSTGS